MQFLEWLRNNTLGVSEAIRQIILVGIVFKILEWDDTQQAAVLMAISGLLSVITSKTNVASGKVDARMEEAKEKGIRIGSTGTGDGTMPPRRFEGA